MSEDTLETLGESEVNAVNEVDIIEAKGEVFKEAAEEYGLNILHTRSY